MTKNSKRHGLLLAPGAGASAESPQLKAVESALSAKLWSVRRFDFPYRKAGRKAPDRPPVLLQAVHDEFDDFAKSENLKPTNVFIGGRSMGGRICSMASTDGLNVAGLVLISYPLHPPGKPQQLRTEHFPKIDVPCLFVSGTRDAFATPEELERHTETITSEVSFYWVEGGDHSLRRNDDEVAEVVSNWLADQPL